MKPYYDPCGACRMSNHVDSYDCPCNPDLRVVCDECEGLGCWKCYAGTVLISRVEADLTPETVIVVHDPEPEEEPYWECGCRSACCCEKPNLDP